MKTEEKWWEDGYRWEDDVELMKVEKNHYDFKNIIWMMKKSVEKLMKNKENKGKQWGKRRKMIKKDGYRWEDDVDVMRNEENHWDSKNITEKLRRNVEK